MAKVKCMNISIRALSCPENGDASFGVLKEGYAQTVDDQAGTGLYKICCKMSFSWKFYCIRYTCTIYLKSVMCETNKVMTGTVLQTNNALEFPHP